MEGGKWKPIAAWSGTLVLPLRSGRRADGGVFIRLENTPPEWSSLNGSTCALTWRAGSPWALHASREIVDITFAGETLSGEALGHDIHPVRLDGWTRVSPLESLAGARPLDDVRVSLRSPSVVVENGTATLVVDTEPVQTEGSLKALARFERPLNEDQTRWVVRHWDKEAHDFSGAEEIVFWNPDPIPAHRNLPQASLDGIHKTAANRYGWYLYADRAADGMLLSAIEPRAIRSAGLAPATGVPLRDYLDHGLWAGMVCGTWFQASVPPETLATGGAAGRTDAPPAFKLGDRGLVAHVFGWRSGPRGDPPDKNGHVPGHAACGFYEIVADSFTGDATIDIEYAQVYSHNPEGIVSGFIASHCFLGSLKRGWLWLTPVSDALIHHPDLAPDGGLPLETLRLSLARMIAHARTGAGSGRTPANMSVSCSQNTALALYEASLGRSGPDHGAAGQTALLLRRILAPTGIGTHRLLPPRWYAYLAGRPVRFASKEQTGRLYLAALLSRNSILPRELHDTLAMTFHELGAALRFVRTNQLGGVIEGIEPHRPTTFKDKYPARRG